MHYLFIFDKISFIMNVSILKIFIEPLDLNALTCMSNSGCFTDSKYYMHHSFLNGKKVKNFVKFMQGF